MNNRQIGYGLFCAVALLYLLTANARGYVPFSAPLARGGGNGGNGSFAGYGGRYIFHK